MYLMTLNRNRLASYIRHPHNNTWKNVAEAVTRIRYMREIRHQLESILGKNSNRLLRNVPDWELEFMVAEARAEANQRQVDFVKILLKKLKSRMYYYIKNAVPETKESVSKLAATLAQLSVLFKTNIPRDELNRLLKNAQASTKATQAPLNRDKAVKAPAPTTPNTSTEKRRSSSSKQTVRSTRAMILRHASIARQLKNQRASQ